MEHFKHVFEVLLQSSQFSIELEQSTHSEPASVKLELHSMHDVALHDTQSDPHFAQDIPLAVTTREYPAWHCEQLFDEVHELHPSEHDSHFP